MNAAALCAGVELGLQPTLFHSANGTPLYAPFHLSQSIPAMALAHLTVAGAVEFALTASVVGYLQRANLPLLRINHGAAPPTHRGHAPGPRLGRRWALIGLATMIALTPLGLLAPGGAFGEDAPSDLALGKYHLTAIPSGLRHYAGFWHNAVFDGYGFGHDNHPAIGYLISAIVGVAAIGAVIFAAFTLASLRRRSPDVDDALEAAKT
jgi:cobalt/nickel transport system permease protein